MPDPAPAPGPESRSESFAKLGRQELRAIVATEWRWFGPIGILRTGTSVRVKVAWGKLLVVLGVFALVLWLTGAAGAYLFVKYKRGFPEVKFVHMLLYPWKQDESRVARGDFLVDQAKELWKERKLGVAGNLLREAATLSPGNRDGRMLLAHYFVIRQRPDLAEKHLLAGVDLHQFDQEYLERLFSFLLQRQADETVVELTERLLKEAASDADRARARLIATARATALFFRGNYDAAEDVLREYRLGDTSDGQLLRIRIEWERGERETALVRLQILTEEQPENEQVYGQYAAYLRELHRYDELRRLCLLRQIAYPERSRARIDLLYLYDRDGNEPNVQSGIEEVFADFAQDGGTLLALADFAANSGRPALARRIYDYCKANSLPWEGPALMTVEAYVVAKEYKAALEACRQMIKDNPEWGRHFASVFDGLQSIAYFGLRDAQSGQLFLDNFLNQAGVRADNLVAVSNRLVSVGAKDQARQVLAQAVRADPLNQSALVGLIRLELDVAQSDTLPANIRALLSMRKPPRELLRDAYDKLGSDRFIFVPGRAALLQDLLATIEKQRLVGSS
jgi:Flp pilus assembly protein TadD